ncbi:hypothetical protein [Larkinella humicola]|uniref:Cytochrome b561-like protein n=1 Tax=Larkinella humicola TaxID=2607654 RepID=A0A5N1JLX0_9BACT|nr:hypothetical protein [Larkinella humicola]KAA9357131.1 hypothetical protein F0P93_05190 [Larkinella humicola]
MYSFLLSVHSAFRWLVLLSVLYGIYRGFRGWFGKRSFTRTDNATRHITATICHIQLLIGYVLYFNSPLIQYFRLHYDEARKQFDLLFFGLIHVILMTVAIVLITIGSSASKRMNSDRGKFKTLTIWFFLALLILLSAIPWPFSPLASRPYFRSF